MEGTNDPHTSPLVENPAHRIPINLLKCTDIITNTKKFLTVQKKSKYILMIKKLLDEQETQFLLCLSLSWVSLSWLPFPYFLLLLSSSSSSSTSDKKCPLLTFQNPGDGREYNPHHPKKKSVPHLPLKVIIIAVIAAFSMFVHTWCISVLWPSWGPVSPSPLDTWELESQECLVWILPNI